MDAQETSLRDLNSSLSSLDVRALAEDVEEITLNTNKAHRYARAWGWLRVSEEVALNQRVRSKSGATEWPWLLLTDKAALAGHETLHLLKTVLGQQWFSARWKQWEMARLSCFRYSQNIRFYKIEAQTPEIQDALGAGRLLSRRETANHPDVMAFIRDAKQYSAGAWRAFLQEANQPRESKVKNPELVSRTCSYGT